MNLAEHLREAIARLDGVTESESMFKDGLAYWVNGKEVAHFDAGQTIDIRLTRDLIRSRRAELRADPRYGCAPAPQTGSRSSSRSPATSRLPPSLQNPPPARATRRQERPRNHRQQAASSHDANASTNR